MMKLFVSCVDDALGVAVRVTALVCVEFGALFVDEGVVIAPSSEAWLPVFAGRGSAVIIIANEVAIALFVEG